MQIIWIHKLFWTEYRAYIINDFQGNKMKVNLISLMMILCEKSASTYCCSITSTNSNRYPIYFVWAVVDSAFRLSWNLWAWRYKSFVGIFVSKWLIPDQSMELTFLHSRSHSHESLQELDSIIQHFSINHSIPNEFKSLFKSILHEFWYTLYFFNVHSYTLGMLICT